MAANTKFSQLSIRKQILIGISVISLTIFTLMFILVSMNSYILINYLYYDTKYYLDKHENSLIEAVGFQFEIGSSTSRHIRGSIFQNLRNLYENILRNDDFRQVYTQKVNEDFRIIEHKDPSIVSVDRDFCRKDPNSCVVYKSYKNDTTIEDIEYFHKAKKGMKILSSFLKSIKKVHIFQASNNLIYGISFLSTPSATFFRYPYTENYNPQFELKDFVELVDSQLNYLAKFGEESDFQRNKTKISAKNLYRELLISPILTYNTNIHKSRPFENSPSNSQFTDSIIKLNKSITEVYRNSSYFREDLLIYKNVQNNILVDIGTESIDFFLNSFNQAYPGFYILVMSKDKNTYINHQFCKFFLKLYEIDNGYTNYTNKDLFEKNYEVSGKYEVSQCFMPPAKDKFITYFMSNDTYDSDTMIREIRMNLYENINSNFKIFKSLLPTFTSEILLKTSYKNYLKMNIFIIKNTKYNINEIDNIFHLFISMLFQIMTLNLIIWYFVIFITLLILYRVSSNISNPIKLLVTAISNIGMNKSSKDADFLTTIEEISYPNDKDIDDTFQICKSLIKGALRKNKDDVSYKENELYKQMNYLSHAYNNVSYIKSNNFILEDEALNRVFNEQTSVFNFKPNESSHVEREEKQLIELLKKDYYIEDELEDILMSRKVKTCLETEREEMFRLVEEYNVDFENHPYYEYFQGSDLRILTI